MKRQTGFTLVELVIVIAVLGILAGLAIPYFMEAREEAAKKECLANRTQIMRMFHAQRAVGYNGELAPFLVEVTDENSENKYFTFQPKCADNGKYSVADEYVVCSIEGHNEDIVGFSTIPEDLLKKFNDMIDSFYKDGVLDVDVLNKLLGITNAGDWLLTKNDQLRDAFYKTNGGWVEGTGIDGQKIYFKFLKTADGIFIYANQRKEFLNSSESGSDWNAQYIYDAATQKWFYNSKGKGFYGSENKTEQDLVGEKNAGWTEVTLSGNTFSK